MYAEWFITVAIDNSLHCGYAKFLSSGQMTVRSDLGHHDSNHILDRIHPKNSAPGTSQLNVPGVSGSLA